MQIHIANLDNCADAVGVVVAIDVIRAYTTAAYALAAGASRVILTGTVEEALALRQSISNSLVMGEVNGLPAPGFDFGNSPSIIRKLNLAGRTPIHRTTAGTQGAIRATRASHLFGASFTVASATVRCLRALQPENLTLVVTGQRPDDPADEDLALADYLSALLTQGETDPSPFLARVRASFAAQKFLDPSQPEFPSEDLDCCLSLDCFSFAMPIVRREGLHILLRQEITNQFDPY